MQPNVMSTVSKHAALVVVDMQPDFMPGGPLGCHEGDRIMDDINALLVSRDFRHVVATQDWHPHGHVSFASQHEGCEPFEERMVHGQLQTLWPDHCVQGTAGAALHETIDWSPVHLILRKGTDRQVDSYSAFRENHAPDGSRPTTGLAGWLREREVESVYVCGLARDVCVLWTAQDAAAEGFDTHVLWDLTRPVTPDTDQTTRGALASAGISIAAPGAPS